MNVPTDYVEGYEKARKINPTLADRYVEHTTIGDPEADAMIDELTGLGRRESGMLLRAAMDDPGGNVLKDAPKGLQDMIGALDSPPSWVNYDEFRPGGRMFLRNSQITLAAFVAGVLVEGFVTNISKSFFITGRVRDQGVRRLKQNNRHMLEIYLPGGLERGGDGLKLTVRLRIVHAQVRKLLLESGEWDSEAWGMPLSMAHLGYAISAFSARLLHHMGNLGVTYTQEERDSFMAVWRYAGYIMGIPETILFKAEQDALELFEIANICEPPPGEESVAMAHSLINSAPLVAGIEEPQERDALAKYVFRVSRALIGQELADGLQFPKSRVFGVLPWFRTEVRLQKLLGRWFPKVGRKNNFSQFAGLLATAYLEESEISYQMPDHVYSEESRSW